MARPPLLVIAGVTASGKTDLSIRAAEALRDRGIEAHVISADSRQVYRGLDIGTAKVSIEDRRGVPHHGLDLAGPDQPVSVVDYMAHVDRALEAIAGAGGLAILVGGTGLYLRAVARGMDAAALPSDPATRAMVEQALAADGLAGQAARLSRLAPRLAGRTDLANPRRVARALEIAILQGDAPLPKPRGYPAASAWVGLRPDPAQHHVALADRARAQFEAGLLDEARALRERFNPALPAFSAIGYREAWAVLDGALTLEAAISQDAARNVRFARRQATWFRAEPGIRWLAPGASALSAVVETAAMLAATGQEGAGSGRPVAAVR